MSARAVVGGISVLNQESNPVIRYNADKEALVVTTALSKIEIQLIFKANKL